MTVGGPINLELCLRADLGFRDLDLRGYVNRLEKADPRPGRTARLAGAAVTQPDVGWDTCSRDRPPN